MIQGPDAFTKNIILLSETLHFCGFLVTLLLRYICLDLLDESRVSGVLEVLEGLPHNFLLVITTLGLLEELQELAGQLVHQLHCGRFERVG